MQNLPSTSIQNVNLSNIQAQAADQSNIEIARQGKYSLLESLAFLSDGDRETALAGLPDRIIEQLEYDWLTHARPNQLPPPGDWVFWLLQAGRGFGKTRTGAETIREWASHPLPAPIHLVAPTAADVRTVMIEGPGGLMSCYPPNECPQYEPSRRLVTFPNGNTALTFSADEPERLRGPQCCAFWADELAAWRFVEEAWDNLLFGFRLGKPRGVITTTPKPIKRLRELAKDPDCVVTRASSYENRVNLAPEFFKSIIAKYEGTRLGRQELLAELLEDIPGALWTRSMIEATRVHGGEFPFGDIIRCVVGVDPAVTAHETSDETGIVVAALASNGHVYIMADVSMRGSPLGWATAVAQAYVTHKADRIVGEINKGFDLVESNIRNVLPHAAFRPVRATRNKRIRAEPVAALYEQGRAHHVGARFEDLEDQMCSFVQDVTTDSPDRMDALVWAVTDLIIDPEEREFVMVEEPAIRISRY